MMASVTLLRWAENKISAMSNPITAIPAPMTSSLRSSLRVSHHLGSTETGAGLGGAADFFFGADAALSFPPLAEGKVFPPGFPLDFGGEEGVFRGIVLKYSTNGLFFFSRSFLQTARPIFSISW